MELTTEFHDAIRFESKSEAKAAKEIYTVVYAYPKMTVTDPDGNKTELPMTVNVDDKLHYKDSIVLLGFFDKDMPLRTD